ncbi:MAG: site-specific integrase [Planctomycetales bacterium]|nr:site-specific integrase [Planctomycetales bacterium]
MSKTTTMETVERTETARGRGRRDFGRIYRKRSPHSGRVLGRWYVRFTLPDGRRMERAVSPDRRDAQKFLRDRWKEYDQAKMGNLRPVQRRLFEDWAEEYLRLVEGSHTESTIQSETSKIRSVLVPAFRGRHLDEIRREDVAGFLAKRKAEGASKATRNRDKAVLGAMFKRAIVLNCARENPTAGIEGEREEKREVPFLDREQQEKLVASCPGYLRAVVHLALRTGLRESETLGLGWQSVDWSRRVIRIPKSKNGTPREVPLPKDVAENLRELETQRGPVPFDPSTKPDRVFAHLPEKWSGMMQKDWKRATVAAGLGKEFRFHDCRHVALSWMVSQGLPLTALMRVSGHRSLAAAQKYLHFAPGAAAEEARRLLDRPAANPAKRAAV